MIDLRNGDCIEQMRQLPPNSVDSIVTDPPYELGFMGKSWDSTGIAYSVKMWDEALRVLKPGGHLLAFSGSRTYHRMACAIEDAGFEIRDQIMWVYGSGFPKSMDVSKAIDKQAGVEREVVGQTMHARKGVAEAEDRSTVAAGAYGEARLGDVTVPTTDKAKQWEGWGTALKPAHEPIVLARKPLIGTVATNVIIHGTGALNIDGSRVKGLTEKELNWTPQRQHSENPLQIGGAKSGDVFSMYKEEGRWPANFIHDGSDEVVELFPDKAGGGFGKRGALNGGATEWGFKGEMQEVGYGDSGSAARFFYCAKASKKDRNEGLDDFAGKEVGTKGNGLARTCASCSASTLQGCECPDRTYVNPTRANHHPTVKPTDLMRYLVRMVTPPNGTVLDPFMGSGSTGKAAVLERFSFIGIDQSADYLEIATARIKHAEQQIEGQLL
jgi:site-specific DNA-methyltransferase (adenine-specific)